MPRNMTMLDLITAVSEFAETESELVATVIHLVNSGQIRLCGNFRGARFVLDVTPPVAEEAALTRSRRPSIASARAAHAA